MMRELEHSFEANPYEVFSTGHVQNLQKIIGETFKIKRDLGNLAKKWGSTSHFNIVDKWGNAINTTMSNGEGCGFMVPNTNIMMNNMLGELSLLPNGFHTWDTGDRLSSMMSPTLVADSQGDFEIAIGTGGGSRIPAAIAQVLHYLIDFDLDTTTAVNAARMHNEHNELNLEPQLVGNDLVEEHLKVVNWKTSSMFFGGVHTIQKKDGTFHAAADDRREGFAIKL
jgi:gamma-glutamyltranspeptidase/glutathione hydrolase